MYYSAHLPASHNIHDLPPAKAEPTSLGVYYATSLTNASNNMTVPANASNNELVAPSSRIAFPPHYQSLLSGTRSPAADKLQIPASARVSARMTAALKGAGRMTGSRGRRKRIIPQNWISNQDGRGLALMRIRSQVLPQRKRHAFVATGTG